MTQVTKTEHDVKVTRYAWKCPDCGRAVDQNEKPESDDLLCYPCVLKCEKEEWLNKHVFLLNSTITDLQWTAGMGFRGLIVCDVDGKEWAIKGPVTCERVKKCRMIK